MLFIACRLEAFILHYGITLAFIWEVLERGLFLGGFFNLLALLFGVAKLSLYAPVVTVGSIQLTSNPVSVGVVDVTTEPFHEVGKCHFQSNYPVCYIRGCMLLLNDSRCTL